MSQTINFEDYLRDIHAKNYMGTDDDMIDAFENWLADMSREEIIDYADLWASELLANTQK